MLLDVVVLGFLRVMVFLLWGGVVRLHQPVRKSPADGPPDLQFFFRRAASQAATALAAASSSPRLYGLTGARRCHSAHVSRCRARSARAFSHAPSSSSRDESRPRALLSTQRLSMSAGSAPTITSACAT